MSDLHHVFARFSTAGATETPSRQTVTIPARGTRGSRVVQVVRLRHGARADEEAPARHAADVGGAAWGEEISGRGSPPMPAAPQETASPAPQPIAHVLPAWQPRQSVVEETVEAPLPRLRRSATPRSAHAAGPRRVADPFDANDDSANCIRCGYLVEPAREKRGLMTCAGCQ